MPKVRNDVIGESFNTLLGWLQLIPEEILRTHPRLYSQYADLLLYSGQPEAAEVALNYLERTAQADTGLQGELAVYRLASAYKRSDFNRGIEFGEKALALLSPDNLRMRAMASYLLGYTKMSRARLEEARLLLTDAYEMGKRAGDYWFGAAGAAYLSHILLLRGRLREALNIGQEAIGLGGQSPSASIPR